MPHTTQQQPKHPHQTRRATIVLYAPCGTNAEHLAINLPHSVVKLLRTLDLLQRRQRGETVESTSESATVMAAIDSMSPGEVESSIAAGVELVLACNYQRREEIVRASSADAERLRKAREWQEVQSGPVDARQAQVAAQLERMCHHGRTWAEVKAGHSD